MEIVINRRTHSVPFLPIAAGVLLVALLFWTMKVARIQANEIGIFVNNVTGVITVRTEPGASVYNGWMSDFYSLDNTQQTYRMVGNGDARASDSVNIKTSNGADVGLDVAINYRLASDEKIIAEKVIPECGLTKVADGSNDPNDLRRASALVDAYKVKWIRDFARSVARYKFGELTPKEFYDTEKRSAKAREAVDELNRLLKDHGIVVTLVVPENFNFYPELVEIINQKKAAEQEVDKQKSLARAALEEQKREMTKAEAKKNVALETTKGELARDLLQIGAEEAKELKAGEAYAYRTRTAADADFYKAKNEAQSILVRAQAEADGLTALAQALSGAGALNIVKMKYAEALMGADISGVPYSTDPRIQKVELSTNDNSTGGRR